MANRGEKVASEELTSCSCPDLAAAAFGGGASGPSAAPEGRAMGEIAQDISVSAPLADPKIYKRKYDDWENLWSEELSMLPALYAGATPSVVEALGDTFSLGREIKEDHPDYLVVTTKARVRVDNGKPGRQLRKGASIRRGGFVGAKDGQIHPTF